jgi:hypothetical protein
MNYHGTYIILTLRSLLVIIAFMNHLLTGRRTFAAITWLLAGLVLIGGLLNSRPAMKGALVNAEERSLEFELGDDDKNDSREQDFVDQIHIGDRTSSQVWYKVQERTFSPVPQTELDSHSVRGPPCC